MKYRVDAYKNGAVRQGTKLLTDIDEAIKLAKQVATHYQCYTRIARVTCNRGPVICGCSADEVETYREEIDNVSAN